jgi:hypothetical protein
MILLLYADGSRVFGGAWQLVELASTMVWVGLVDSWREHLPLTPSA